MFTSAAFRVFVRAIDRLVLPRPAWLIVLASTVAPGCHEAGLQPGGPHVMTDLGTLGGSFSTPVALNDAGQIVGWSTIAGDAEWHGVVWANGAMTDLGTLSGTFSEAVDINEAGQIVGRATTAGDQDWHAVLWRPQQARGRRFHGSTTGTGQ